MLDGDMTAGELTAFLVYSLYVGINFGQVRGVCYRQLAASVAVVTLTAACCGVQRHAVPVPVRGGCPRVTPCTTFDHALRFPPMFCRSFPLRFKSRRSPYVPVSILCRPQHIGHLDLRSAASPPPLLPWYPCGTSIVGPRVHALLPSLTTVFPSPAHRHLSLFVSCPLCMGTSCVLRVPRPAFSRSRTECPCCP